MKNRIERIEYIKAQSSNTSNNRTFTINNWRENQLVLAVIRIDADYLMYRIENSRTIRQQLQYKRNHPNSSSNIFDDPESPSAQSAQEEILLKMIESSGQAFLQDLETRGQEQPSIITYDGFIINGNRRTAALRAKLNVQYIECVVLPENAVAKDYYALEQELQISKDFKEDYHWINELANIRRGIREKPYLTSEDVLAKRLRITKSELRAKVVMMDLVDNFLIWKQMPNAYDYGMLDDAEQIFIELEKVQRKYKDKPLLRKELNQAVFSLIEKRPEKGRLYTHVRNLIKDFEPVYERMKTTVIRVDENSYGDTEAGVIEVDAGNDMSYLPDKEPEFDLIGEILDINDSNDTSEEPIFDNPNDAHELSSLLIETIADVKAETREKLDAEAVYNAVSSALRELHGLSIDSTTAKITSIKNKLEQIKKLTEELLKEVNTFEQESNS